MASLSDRSRCSGGAAEEARNQPGREPAFLFQRWSSLLRQPFAPSFDLAFPARLAREWGRLVLRWEESYLPFAEESSAPERLSRPVMLRAGLPQVRLAWVRQAFRPELAPRSLVEQVLGLFPAERCRESDQLQ